METNNNDTQNKQSVLITGGCGGVASASAALFLERGAQVLLTDINEERLKKTVEKLSSLPGELRSWSVLGDKGAAVYCASKGGVNLLTKALAIEG